MMPEFATGFWQSKLRYASQEELLSVAREYKRRNLPVSVIVADFYHWPSSGDWKFDPKFWPDSRAMVEELDSMGIKLLVSIWPTVRRDSENYEALRKRNYLIRPERLDRDPALWCGAMVRGYLWQFWHSAPPGQGRLEHLILPQAHGSRFKGRNANDAPFVLGLSHR